MPTRFWNENYVESTLKGNLNPFPSPFEYTVVVRVGANSGVGDPFGFVSAFVQAGTEFHFNFKGDKLDSFTWVIGELEGGLLTSLTSGASWLLSDDRAALARSLEAAGNEFGWKPVGLRYKNIRKLELARLQWFNKGNCTTTAICGGPDVLSGVQLHAEGADFKIPIPISIGGEIDMEWMWLHGGEASTAFTEFGRKKINSDIVVNRPEP